MAMGNTTVDLVFAYVIDLCRTHNITTLSFVDMTTLFHKYMTKPVALNELKPNTEI